MNFRELFELCDMNPQRSGKLRSTKTMVYTRLVSEVYSKVTRASGENPVVKTGVLTSPLP